MVKNITFSVSTQKNIQRCFLSKWSCLYSHMQALKTWTIGSVMFAMIFCFSISVEAGMVYGRVYSADKNFQKEVVVTFVGEKNNHFQVKTDRHNGYSIFLPPGIYKVEYKESGRTWKAWIKSFPQSVRQDIFLK